MVAVLKGIKLILNFFAIIVIFIFLVIILNPAQIQYNKNVEISKIYNLLPFSISSDDIAYQDASKIDSSATKPAANETISATREEVLRKAKEMAEVKWTPKYNLVDEKGSYTFKKGKTYYGIPYSMDAYQVNSASDFLNKINDSKIIYGNDCSGYVSAVWGISRQTTLSFLNAVKSGSKIDNKSVVQISWEELKAGDALLLDDGKGKGHIMLFISIDSKDKDKVNVYEQNIPTIIPYEPVPVARKDARSIDKLKKAGYIPIKLSGLD